MEIAAGDYTSIDTDYTGNDAGAAPGSGGALHVSSEGSDVRITGGTITNNTATSQGGGLWNQNNSFMAVDEVTIMGNTVTSQGTLEGERVAGGGIYNNGGDLNVFNSTISGNVLPLSTSEEDVALTAGGGIANDDGGNLTVIFSTVSGNQATAGGGIANASIAEITNATIVNNTANTGGGYAQEVTLSSSTGRDASVTIRGTIIANNSADSDDDISVGDGAISSTGFNLIESDASNSFPAESSDIEGVDPQLGDLADNGGETMTHAPDSDSPVIDAGDPDDRARDQINQPVSGERRDIGSFEFQGAVQGDFAGQQQESRSSADGTRSVSIYPNPVSQGGQMTVTIPETYRGQLTLRVLDANGRVVQEDYRNATGRYRMDVSGLTSGSYLFQIVGDDDQETVRFVVSD